MNVANLNTKLRIIKTNLIFIVWNGFVFQLLTVRHPGRSSHTGRTVRAATVPFVCHWNMHQTNNGIQLRQQVLLFNVSGFVSLSKNLNCFYLQYTLMCLILFGILKLLHMIFVFHIPSIVYRMIDCFTSANNSKYVDSVGLYCGIFYYANIIRNKIPIVTHQKLMLWHWFRRFHNFLNIPIITKMENYWHFVTCEWNTFVILLLTTGIP